MRLLIGVVKGVVIEESEGGGCESDVVEMSADRRDGGGSVCMIE